MRHVRLTLAALALVFLAFLIAGTRLNRLQSTELSQRAGQASKPGPPAPLTTGSTVQGDEPSIFTEAPGGLGVNKEDVEVYPGAVDQSEISIAVDPTNPLNVLITSNTSDGEVGYYYSSNRGQDWDGSDSPPAPAEADPVCFFDATGDAYFFALIDNGIAMWKSDGSHGTSWGQTTQVSPSAHERDDKEWATVDSDPSSPYFGRIYCAWSWQSQDGYVLFSHSGNSFATAVPLALQIFGDHARDGIGTSLAVGPGGVLYACWANVQHAVVPTTRELGIGFTRSTNGGTNFTSSRELFGIYGNRGTAGPDPDFNGTNANSFPAIAVDNSFGPRRGRVFIVYADRVAGDSDIYIRYSDNQGDTWSSPIRVNEDPVDNGQEQWFPSIACDPINGMVHVAYYNMDQTTGHQTRYWLASSANGGVSFCNTAVSDEHHLPSPISGSRPGYVGDYYGVAAFDGVVYLAWSDNRTGRYKAYFEARDIRLRVPGDYTLAQALLTAQPGDVVEVDGDAQPFYPGSYTVKGGVTLRPQSGVSPVIDALEASGSSALEIIPDPRGWETRIEGFTLRGFEQAGITVTTDCPNNFSTSLTVVDCTILGGSVGIRHVDPDCQQFQLIGHTEVRNVEIVDALECGIEISVQPPSSPLPGVAVPHIIENCTIQSAPNSDSGSAGIRLDMGSGVFRIRQNSVVGWARGVDVVSSGNGDFPVGGMDFSNNAIVNASECGMHTSDVTTQAPRHCVIDVLQGATALCGYSLGSNLIGDAMLCENTAGPIGVASNCAPWNNPWGVWVGSSREIGCMGGVLGPALSAASVVLVDSLVPSGEITLKSDFQLSDGKTLIIDTELQILSDGTADFQLSTGIDPTSNEIIVHGYLTTPAAVTFSSGGPSPQPGDWFGIVVKNGGSINLTSATIENCTYGVCCPDLAEDVSVTEGTIRRFTQRGVQVNQIGIGASANLTVEDSSIDATDGLTGVLILGAHSALLRDVTITGDATSMHGIQLGAIGSGGSQVVVERCTISGLTTGRGLRVEADSPTIQANLISDCKWGIELLGSGTPAVSPIPGSPILKNTLSGCTIGIYSGSQVNPTIDRAVISNTSTSAPIGLYTDSTATGTYTGLTISGHQTGFKAHSVAAHSLIKSSITGFGSYGVLVGGAGIVTLGCSNSNNGNSISSTLGSVVRFVRVATPRMSGLPDICATNNFWGASTPPASKFSSFVGYNPWLSSEPPLMQAGTQRIETASLAPKPFAATPNPFTGPLSFAFTVPDGGPLPVEIGVFDLAGRALWRPATKVLPAGGHEFNWDGRSDDGTEVGAGVFFARLRLGSELQTIKLVKVR